MKYKVGDKVRINSLDWYNKNKGNDGIVEFSTSVFVPGMSQFCGKVVTIEAVFDEGDDDDVIYCMEEIGYDWTDEMFEGLAEVTEIAQDAKIFSEGYDQGYEDGQHDMNEWVLPEGFEFSDENGNIINATKISLRKKKEIIPNLQLDSVRTVREYDTAHSRIWLEIYVDNPTLCIFTHLLVDEDHRRKGYGTKALEQAEIIAKDLGCDTIHLKVKTDSWMRKWYLRSGYKFLTNAEDNYTWLTKSI